LIVISVVAGVVLMVSAWFDIFERFAAWSGRYNRWQVNEVVSVLVFLSAALAIFSWRRWRELKAEVNRRQEYSNLFRLANDPILIFDAAEAIVLATEKYDGPDPVNVGSGFEISIRDLVHLIAQLTGFRGEVRWDVRQPNGQPRRRLDTSRAEQAFGFRATTDFREGLERTIAWYESAKQRA